MKVKICGITNLDDAKYAQELGVDYIGYVFFQDSPRQIYVGDAADISDKVTVKKVGVFVNEIPSIVAHIVQSVGLDVVQLHGEESPEYCSQLKGKAEIWKAIRVKDESSLDQIRNYEVDAILLDKYVEGVQGGTGKTLDWNLAKIAQSYHKRIILSGGMTPENVKKAISIANPDCVDTSSGVQDTYRKKCHKKMREFCSEVRG